MTKSCYACNPMITNKKEWWPRAELNHRHKDFQSSALPTELLGREGEIIAERAFLFGAADAEHPRQRRKIRDSRLFLEIPCSDA